MKNLNKILQICNDHNIKSSNDFIDFYLLNKEVFNNENIDLNIFNKETIRKILFLIDTSSTNDFNNYLPFTFAKLISYAILYSNSSNNISILEYKQTNPFLLMGIANLLEDHKVKISFENRFNKEFSFIGHKNSNLELNSVNNLILDWFIVGKESTQIIKEYFNTNQKKQLILFCSVDYFYDKELFKMFREILNVRYVLKIDGKIFSGDDKSSSIYFITNEEDIKMKFLDITELFDEVKLIEIVAKLKD